MSRKHKKKFAPPVPAPALGATFTLKRDIRVQHGVPRGGARNFQHFPYIPVGTPVRVTGRYEGARGKQRVDVMTEDGRYARRLDWSYWAGLGDKE